MQLILDATSITTFLRCREEFRLTYLENRRGVYTAIHREAGIAFHKAVEKFWVGAPFTSALATAMAHLKSPLHLIHGNDLRKWQELIEITPDMIAAYYDTVEYTPLPSFQITPPPALPHIILEDEWELIAPFGISNLRLVGRIDRVEAGPVLVDTKTATEIEGEDAYRIKSWERSYRDAMVKDVGLGMYDFYLRNSGCIPVGVHLEVITKPSSRYGKKAKVVRFELPEVLAYRERFDSQLEFICREIRHYVEQYSKMTPWPMNVSACTGKFGNCAFLAICNYGVSKKTEKLYSERQEHLSIGKRIEL